VAAIRTGRGAAVAVVCLAGATAAGLWCGGPPPAQPATAPDASFSAARAARLVERIAERPHHAGSADHGRVRDLLIAEFAALGAAVERQAATVLVGTVEAHAARVENLVFRLPGTASTGAVLLVAHYDSVAAGPGAADDGAGVAAIAETVRALRAGPPLANDVIALVSDAEEFGMLGARAFATGHPRAKDVRRVLNLEARGTSGPLQLFETSAGNGSVVAAWAADAPRPTGSSLAYEVYRRLPNDTDFSVLKKLDTAGLNLAFIGNPERYHTPQDTPAALDLRSLQHMGDTTLALARRFGGMDLGRLRARDAVFFSLPVPGMVVRYSSLLALPLAAAACGLMAIAFLRARRRRETSIPGALVAAVLFAAFAAASTAAGWRFGRWSHALHARWMGGGSVVWIAAWAGALVGSIATAWCALYAALRKVFAAHSIAFGAMLVLACAELALAWFVVGASYVLVWPLAGAALAAMALRAAWDIPPGAGPARALVITAFGLPAVLVLWPLVGMLFTAMGLSPQGGAAMGAVAACALGALAVPLEVVAQGRRWWPAALALAATIASLAAGMAGSRYSERFPRAVNAYYALHADTRAAHWAVQSVSAGRPEPSGRDGWPDQWARQYVGDEPHPGRPYSLVPPWSTLEGTPGFLTAGAPLLDLPAPRASLLSSARSEGGRSVRIRVFPAREGRVLSVWVHGSQVLDAAVDDLRIAGPMPARRENDTAWSLDYVNAPAPGIVLTLVLRDARPLTVAVLDRTAGLPAVPGRAFAPRPATVTPIQFGDQTVVRRTYVF